MESEDGKDLKLQAEKLRGRLWRGTRTERTHGSRHRICQALLLFVVISGGMLLGVPRMRTALRERVDILREAHRTGETGILVLHMQVGENRQPFPEEYAKPAPPIWRQAGIYVLGSQTYSATIRYEAGASRVQAETGGAVSPEGIYGAEMTTSPVEPEFKQGALEREAYNLLLQTHGTLESMVKGEVAALSFKNWSAARIEEGKYLVRVTFNKDSEETNRDYIWSVNLASKDVVALSAYARSIAK